MKIKTKDDRRRRIQLRQRKRISGSSERPRLSVFRSVTHIYAQVIDDLSGKTLASASSTEAAVKGTFEKGVTGGNLKGVKESGKAFAVPTYFFVVNMGLLLGLGALRWAGLLGGLDPIVIEDPNEVVPFGAENPALWMGIGLFVLLRAFASGGAAVTGVEAISNGVPAFREPAWKNARQTLVIMGTLLGVMVTVSGL